MALKLGENGRSSYEVNTNFIVKLNVGNSMAEDNNKY